MLAGPAAAINIGFDPDSQSVVFGSSLEVDIVFSNSGGEIVSTYDLDITYDSSVLDATGVIFTTALGDELFFEVFSDALLSTRGIVDPFQLSLLSDLELPAIQGGDSITVATLMFDAIGVGTTKLGFVFDDFNDVKGSNALVLPIIADNGFVRVQAERAIPEPSAALLFFLGVVLLRPALRR